MANSGTGEDLRQRTDFLAPLRTLGRMLRRLIVPVFILLVAWALFYGWQVRGEEYLTAEEGIGYGLGILGGVLMLSQLLYTLRKKLRLMHRWGRVGTWFQAHMAVGVIAPVVILYHANFGLGSVNSNVALGAMGLVVASGLIGRYIYTKVNVVLRGRVATLVELKAATDEARAEMRQDLVMDEALAATLQAYEDKVLKGESARWPVMILELLSLGSRARAARWRLQRQAVRALRRRAREEQWVRDKTRGYIGAARRHIRAYVASVRQVAEYRIYKRIFALWHVLHIPLFLMLVISGVVHVVAVHLY